MNNSSTKSGNKSIIPCKIDQCCHLQASLALRWQMDHSNTRGAQCDIGLPDPYLLIPSSSRLCSPGYDWMLTLFRIRCSTDSYLDRNKTVRVRLIKAFIYFQYYIIRFTFTKRKVSFNLVIKVFPSNDPSSLSWKFYSVAPVNMSLFPHLFEGVLPTPTCSWNTLHV